MRQMLPALVAIFLLTTPTVGQFGGSWSPYAPPSFSGGWNLRNFTSMVVFGDSYSDDSRLGYFINHDGQPPPPGWNDPPNYQSADGGRPWVEYVKQYAQVNLYNYAVSGAVCSNDITPRYFSLIHQDFPAVQQYEVPAWLADAEVVEPNGAKFLVTPQEETVYTLFDGTNDIGVGAFITDSQVPGTNIVNYTNCIFDQLETIYQHGGRYFVLMNVVPLNLAPLYALPSQGGVGDNQYWPDKPSNLTEISFRMLEEVATVNAIYKYQLPYEIFEARDFSGASFALFNVHDLFLDIYNHPTQYLNGSAPANVTGYIHHCNINQTVCTSEASPDSFMWYDELHLSEQTARVLAREYVKVVQGTSSYATYYPGYPNRGW